MDRSDAVFEFWIRKVHILTEFQAISFMVGTGVKWVDADITGTPWKDESNDCTKWFDITVSKHFNGFTICILKFSFVCIYDIFLNHHMHFVCACVDVCVCMHQTILCSTGTETHRLKCRKRYEILVHRLVVLSQNPIDKSLSFVGLKIASTKRFTHKHILWHKQSARERASEWRSTSNIWNAAECLRCHLLVHIKYHFLIRCH